MQRAINSSALPILLLLTLFAATSAAASDEREKWMVGRWTMSAHGRPDRTVVFHADHRWGVELYVPVSADSDRFTTREDIRGRRWRISGDALILRYPSDDGFETHPYKILSFAHDEVVTDIFTYTRAKPSRVKA
jgi:hypothetical protein